VYGLAEQADPDTEPRLLDDALADADSRVRLRACMAIGACIQPDSVDRRRFAELLLQVIRTDSEQDVRAFAASALLRLAGKEHLGRIIEARAGEEALAVRERLDRVIRRLGDMPPEQGDPQ
jgi:HEAT repeat protein